MEYLDILDDKGDKTREVRSYEDAHKKGLIHKSVHVWLLDSNNQLLIQKREKNQRAYPGYWDISASGHVSTVETSLEAAIKETKEELGIDVKESEIKYLFTVMESIVLNKGSYVNNEFQDVYVVRKNLDINQVKLADGEVEAVRFINIEEFKRWTNGEGEQMVPHEEEYKKLLEYI